jgi:hypothetical protein
MGHWAWVLGPYGSTHRGAPLFHSSESMIHGTHRTRYRHLASIIACSLSTQSFVSFHPFGYLAHDDVPMVIDGDDNFICGTEKMEKY